MEQCGGIDDAITFTTLGMFIIDEIEYESPIPPSKNIIGGAGTYAAIGARLVTPRHQAKRVGWTVDIGSDFPPDIKHVIDTWDTTCVFRHDSSRLTTRGWNGYGRNEFREFKYLTPKLRLDQHTLPEVLVFAKSFHLICSPSRCIDLVKGILKRRAELRPLSPQPRPLFAWEPVPDLCTPEEYSNFQKAIRVVDIVSPNQSELASFLGKKDPSDHENELQSCVDEVLKTGIGPNGDGALIVRLGKDGSYCKWKGKELKLNSYHEAFKSADLPKDEFQNCRLQSVIDPTGGGNTFVGAFAQAVVSKETQYVEQMESNFWHNDDGTVNFTCSHLQECLIWSLVAASFAIEQIGMPVLSRNKQGEELWNSERVHDRITLYRRIHELT